MTEHKDIPDAQLHEVKGAASATAGRILTATGIGTATFEVPASGWAQYTDTVYTGATKLVVSTSPGVVLPCNKGTSLEGQAPLDMSTSMWNSTTNKFIPVRENDYYILRITFTVATLSGTVNYVRLTLDIGGAIGVVFDDTRVPRAVGQEIVFTVPVYTGSTFIANGGQFTVSKDGGGSFEIQDIGISISRIHRGR